MNGAAAVTKEKATTSSEIDEHSAGGALGKSCRPLLWTGVEGRGGALVEAGKHATV